METETVSMEGMRRLEWMVRTMVSDFGEMGVGRAMICRLCYFCDFGSYELRGTSVSGCDYVLMPGGPEPCGIDRVLDDLVRSREVRMLRRHGTVDFFPGTASGPEAPSEDDARMVDMTVSEYAGRGERILSWMSREDAPCCGRRVSEKLDYASVSSRSGRMSARNWGEA